MRERGAITTVGLRRHSQLTWPSWLCGWPKMPACSCRQMFASSTTTVQPDKDERPETLDAGVPLVSVSLGDTAKFIMGGVTRKESTVMVPLVSGDGFVFGGRSRMRYHGVSALLPGTGPPELQIAGRFNLTFRQGAS